MKLNNLDLNKIPVFCSVVERKSIRLASEELHISSSAVSQSISALEKSLDLNLFIRANRRLIPTPKARVLYKEFQSFQMGLHNSLNNLVATDHGVEGLVRIGSYLEFAKSQLMQPLSSFLRANPKAQVKFVFDSPSRLNQLLETNRIDLAFSIFPHKGVKSIQAKKLFEEELVLVGSKKFIHSKSSLEEILAQPIIDYYGNHLLLRRWIQKHYAKQVQKVPVQIYAAAADMVIELICQEVGIGVVPRYVLERTANSKNLLIVNPKAKQVTDFIWLNEYSGQYQNSAHQAFSQSIYKFFGVKS